MIFYHVYFGNPLLPIITVGSPETSALNLNEKFDARLCYWLKGNVKCNRRLSDYIHIINLTTVTLTTRAFS
jgi:hypothetical protein